MLHVDMPTRSDLEHLIAHREAACVSIYLPTTPLTRDAQADRIALGNLAREAVGQLRSGGQPAAAIQDPAAAIQDPAAAIQDPAAAIQRLEEHLNDLIEDDDFWTVQAHSLVVFATPDRLLTFRLANRLTATAEVADRFHVKPLLRAVTAGQEALVLALAQGGVRLVEVSADLPAAPVAVPDLPRDMSAAVGRSGLDSRSPRGRIQGSEGRKVRMAQYARAVDAALRDLLAGRETPLILAATAPLDSIFRSTCTYPHLARQTIAGNPETISDHDLAVAARGILDEIHADQVRDFAALFDTRSRQGRTTTDIAHAARAATFGAVAHIAADIDARVPGRVDEQDGRVSFAEAASAATYGVVDEIVGRALLSGARVLALRREDVPGNGPLAAILRYPL